jgi:hypothetical protein
MQEDKRNALRREDSAKAASSTIVERHSPPGRRSWWLRCPNERGYRLKLGSAAKVNEELIARSLGEA